MGIYRTDNLTLFSGKVIKKWVLETISKVEIMLYKPNSLLLSSEVSSFVDRQANKVWVR